MAAVQCSRCSAERKGFRRELDSWRHKLIHCVGFESILEGIYGPLLLRDLNLFDDCEPEEVDDWSSDANCSQCSFCNLPLDKLSVQVPAATSPLSSPSDYSPCQAPTIAESSQSAYRFLQAVFHKRDVSLGSDPSIPLAAQELMKKMIHQFAKEYASKCLLHTSTNGVTTRTSSPLTETTDAPLDLTVSRTQEDKDAECEPDGVLDLSKRNPAASSTSSSNHKPSGSLRPSLSEEIGDQGQQETKCLQSSVLDSVLGSLCPSHRSLLYQILKLARQENLLFFVSHRPVGQGRSLCCHCGVNQQDNVNPIAVPLSECKVHNSSPYWPFIDCEHQGLQSTICHSGESKSNISINHYPETDCKREAPLGSSCGCVQRCKMEAYAFFCPKRLHCSSSHCQARGHINNKVCTCSSSSHSLSKSTSLCTAASTLCPSSVVCCNQHNPHPCPCHSNHACLMQPRNTVERGVGDGDPPCPVLKREQSPSPPPLSPIPSDMDKKTDEKPPSLLHHKQEEEADLMLSDHLQNASHKDSSVDTATEEEQDCLSPNGSLAKQNPSKTLLQDVVSRFSEKLETIKPIEKERPLVSSTIDMTEKDHLQSPSSSQNSPFHADSHLTEIITTVLHTGRASDYNLSELFNRHDSKKPKSPNTRSRRRQEVLAAITTPTDDASTRRQTLQIKRELAMLDQSYSRRKVPPAKRPKLKDANVTVTTAHTSDSNTVKEESKRQIGDGLEHFEEHKIGGGVLNCFEAESDEDKVNEDIQTVTVTEEVQIMKSEEGEREIPSVEKDLTLSKTLISTSETQSKDCKEDSKGDSVQTKAAPVTATPVRRGRPCTKASKISTAGRDRKHEKAHADQKSGQESRVGDGKPCPSLIRETQIQQSDSRRSRRNIVPPQRFSSYVTEPMFFVACFSESIFNQKTRKNEDLKTSSLDPLIKDADTKVIHDESKSEVPQASPKKASKQLSHKDENDLSANQVSPQTATKEKNCKRHPNNLTDDKNIGAKPLGRLRSSTRRQKYSETVLKTPETASSVDSSTTPAACVDNSPNSLVLYTSPIKLMYVSPVKDKEGVIYSLKSAGSSGQAEESFDPCEESSWSGVPQKNKNQSTESCTSGVKRISSPLKSAASPARSPLSSKSANSPPKSANSPSKSATSPPKSANSPSKSATSPPKSATSSPKAATSPSKSATSPPKSATSSPKAATSPSKSATSPSKATSTPTKTQSPKSTSSSPKTGLRSEGTPTKRIAGSDSQRSPVNLVSYHETTPPKRRPGRPKKLGPQLEQKVKRPIGRPRKQKAVDSATGAQADNGPSVLPSDIEDNANKNLKITVVYGRSRRNKRTVSEGFDQLQTELHDAWQAAGLKRDFSILMENCKTSSGSIKTAISELPEKLNFPVKKGALQTSSNVKCQKQDDSAPLRKPGRPAKVKISGISVTVTTVSPRQRKIQINKETVQSPETLTHKRVLLPEIKSAKEPRTISCQSPNKTSQKGEEMDAKDENRDELQNQPVAVRQSMRVRKPSIHFLHAVATSTSRSYSRSNALLRRSKQFLLNKVSNDRRQCEQQNSAQTSGGRRQLFGQERSNISKDLGRVAGVSVDSIFTPKETLRWWAASTEKKTTNQELARRIRLISDSWVSDTEDKREKESAFNSVMGTNSSSSLNRKTKHSSVVRTLFDCPPNKPSSCSMQQLCNWFMQTTETQSLSIVKKASSRNPYELMHFPRTANRKSVCHSPQAERLRKHIKKFAKIMPKSPQQHQQAQRRLNMKNMTRRTPPTHNIRRQLFGPRLATSKAHGRTNSSFSKYQAALSRAKTRFLSQKTREGWRNRQRKKKNLKCSVVSGIEPKHNASRRSAKDQLSGRLRSRSATSSLDQTQEPADLPKEQNLCSKAWSPETLKECRVFLRKINSPDTESTEEESDSCTVTLDDGSPSAYHFARRERELEVVKAVKTDRKRSTRRYASRDLAVSALQSVQEKDGMPSGRKNGKYKSPGVVSTEQQPPPAKMLRQSRMRGLTGPRWCDFVFGS